MNFEKQVNDFDEFYSVSMKLGMELCEKGSAGKKLTQTEQDFITYSTKFGLSMVNAIYDSMQSKVNKAN
jgi:hypothetical protein